MGLRDRLRKLEEEVGFEEAVLVTDDGEEIRFSGDPLELILEEWSATTEGRTPDHPLAPYLDRGLRLKHPERATDPVWKMLATYPSEHREERPG